MEKYLIDTNAISHYLSASLPDEGMDFMDKVMDAVPNLSVISQIELLSWKSGKSDQIRLLINDSRIFSLTDDVIEICVRLRLTRKIKTPDAIIAATALAHDYILITDNVRDFANISKLKLINPNQPD